MGGFECSTHLRRPGGERLDLMQATRHDELAMQDYAALRGFGILAVRDGIRWHRIETTPGHYDFTADLPMVRAACQTGTQVIWDLCHYGWPDDLDPFLPQFGHRLAAMARAFVRLLLEEGEARPFVVPINEISFLAWSGGDEGLLPPFARHRGHELKRCLVRAAIETIDAVREVAPQTRICLIDPMINVAGRFNDPENCLAAEEYRQAQYTAWDMMAGMADPELGGKPDYLDIVGLNYYADNQWLHARGGEFVRRLLPGDFGYRPVWDMLSEVYARYGRPLFIAETGAEGHHRAAWLRSICEQVYLAMARGVPIESICLYPILDYPGWADDRHCRTGLFGYADRNGRRPLCWSLGAELLRQQAMLTRTLVVSAQEDARAEQTEIVTGQP